MQRTSAINEEKDSDSEIDLTPMLDVVFIMLIFFIVTASFIKEAGIDVNKPETATPDPQEHANIFVAISENNEIWIEGHLIDPRAIRAYIERLRAENPNGAVVIQAHQRSYTNTLVQVMDASRQAGVYNISMATNTG